MWKNTCRRLCATLKKPLSKIHVLHLIDSLGDGGAQEVVKQIVKQSPADYFRFTVVCVHAKNPRQEPALRKHGADVYFLSPDSSLPLGLRVPLFSLRLRKILKRLKPDILHMHLPGSMVVGCAASAGLPLKRMLNIYAWKKQMPFWVHPVMKFLTPMIQQFQFLSHEDVPWIPKERLIETFAGVDLTLKEGAHSEYLVEEFQLQNRGPFLFTVGRLHPDKGHAYAIQVLQKVKKSLPRAVLFVIGAGDEREETRLKVLARDLGLSEDVLFTGFREDLPNFFHLGGFYLRVAVNEPGNVTNVLAQYFGLFCIGFDMREVLRSNVDFIEDGKTGKLVAFENTDEMAAQVVLFGQNRERFQRISQLSVAFATEHRDIRQVMVEPYNRAYEKLLFVL